MRLISTIFATLTLVCATVAIGATAAKTNATASSTAEFVPAVRLSAYEPGQARDPFARPGERTVRPAAGKAAPVEAYVPEMFRLQAILFERHNPMVVINNQPMELNQAGTLTVGGNVVRVKPIQIGRERMVLEVEGQKMELRLAEPSKESSGPSPANPKKTPEH